MARTPTTQIPLGFQAPDFNLPDVSDGSFKTLNDLKGEKVTLVAFICNHCPFVIHVIEKLSEVIAKKQSEDVGFILISSNDVVNYPDDSPEKMKLFREKYNIGVPYLYDESQEVAKAYDAACTPDFSVFDTDLKCVYRGQMDNSRPGNDLPNDAADLLKVIEYVENGKEIDFPQLPSIGCNIKWK